MKPPPSAPSLQAGGNAVNAAGEAYCFACGMFSVIEASTTCWCADCYEEWYGQFRASPSFPL